MNLSQERIHEFQNKILSWYSKNKRNLPWRQTTNPYYIHLSEIMLAQTQVDRVIPYYRKFIKAYPTLDRLSKANKPDLLRLWQGLGYNNRIIRFQECASILLKNHKGHYPQTQEELITLPGIGPYTAAAILVFAHNKEVPVIDTNIRRILMYEFKLKEDTSYKELEKVAKQLIPKRKSRDYHNALMDYGALELTAKRTQIKSLGKQSKFLGSTRWVRSQILKEILDKKELELTMVQEQFKEYDINMILNKMQKDNLLILENNKIKIQT